MALPAAITGDPRTEHRTFLNRYYGLTHGLYDVSRRFYLAGRDRALAVLLESPWQSLIEVGCGTGRNLRRLHDARPAALLGGVDASDAMLAHARARAPHLPIIHGFAEDVDFASVLGTPPDRIFFSYALSMFTEPGRALEHARRSLAPGGQVVVVDFAEDARLGFFSGAFARWLARFRVRPLPLALFRDGGIALGKRGYYVIAQLPALPRT